MSGETFVKDYIKPDIVDKAPEKVIIRKIIKPKLSLGYRFFKRLMDIVFGIVGTLVLLIPMLIIAVIIKLDSKGPVLYKQERLGLDGKRFMIYKFRSMVLDAEKDGAQWADENDGRCTRVGAVLRKCRLDELPQIPFNILVGNLSVVGPRPEREVFYNLFSEYIDGFEQRLYVKPGLTGLAQVNGGYDLNPEEKIIYDIEYIEKCNIWMDLKLMVKTVTILFNHDGAR